MIPLYLPSHLARQIESEAAGAYPRECCGILLGRDDQPNPAGESHAARRVSRVLPAENVFEPSQQGRRFSIEPRQIMFAERDAALQGMLVIGFYHSHPDHPARPSEFDREQAWPFYSYIIVAVHGAEVIDLTSWVLDDETRVFRRQDILEGEKNLR